MQTKETEQFDASLATFEAEMDGIIQKYEAMISQCGDQILECRARIKVVQAKKREMSLRYDVAKGSHAGTDQTSD